MTLTSYCWGSSRGAFERQFRARFRSAAFGLVRWTGCQVWQPGLRRDGRARVPGSDTITATRATSERSQRTMINIAHDKRSGCVHDKCDSLYLLGLRCLAMTAERELKQTSTDDGGNHGQGAGLFCERVYFETSLTYPPTLIDTLPLPLTVTRTLTPALWFHRSIYMSSDTHYHGGHTVGYLQRTVSSLPPWLSCQSRYGSQHDGKSSSSRSLPRILRGGSMTSMVTFSAASPPDIAFGIEG